MPNGERVEGYGETHLKNLKVDEIIQFVRFGFCKLDKKGSYYNFYFAHG